MMLQSDRDPPCLVCSKITPSIKFPAMIENFGQEILLIGSFSPETHSNRFPVDFPNMINQYIFVILYSLKLDIF